MKVERRAKGLEKKMRRIPSERVLIEGFDELSAWRFYGTMARAWLDERSSWRFCAGAPPHKLEFMRSIRSSLQSLQNLHNSRAAHRVQEGAMLLLLRRALRQEADIGLAGLVFLPIPQEIKWFVKERDNEKE